MLTALFRRAGQAALLKREAFLWMFFEDQATGDALILVSLTAVALVLALPGSHAVLDLIQAMIAAMFSWLIVAGLVWAAARFVFGGSGEYVGVMRVAGFGYPTLLLWLVTVRLLDLPFGSVLGSVWFLAVLAAGLRVVMELPLDRAWSSALVGFLGWLVISTLVSGLGFL